MKKLNINFSIYEYNTINILYKLALYLFYNADLFLIITY